MKTSSLANRRLRGRISDPASPTEIAAILGVSPTTVYASQRRFWALRVKLAEAVDDAERRAIMARMSQEIPCSWRSSGSDDQHKGGRYLTSADLFVRWYTSGGLDDDVLDALYGTVAS